MSNKKEKQKILNNEVNEEKLDKISGGKKFTAGNFEKKTEDVWIRQTGIPRN